MTGPQRQKRCVSQSDRIGKASAPPSGVKSHTAPFPLFPCFRVLSRCPRPILWCFSHIPMMWGCDPIYRSALGRGYQGFRFISYGFPNITYKNFTSDIAGIKAVFTLKQGFLNRMCIRITCRVC